MCGLCCLTQSHTAYHLNPDATGSPPRPAAAATVCTDGATQDIMENPYVCVHFGQGGKE